MNDVGNSSVQTTKFDPTLQVNLALLLTEPIAGLPLGINRTQQRPNPTTWTFLPMPRRHYGSKLLENASKGQNYLQFCRLELPLWVFFTRYWPQSKGQIQLSERFRQRRKQPFHLDLNVLSVTRLCAL